MGKAKRQPRVFLCLGNWLHRCRKIRWRKSCAIVRIDCNLFEKLGSESFPAPHCLTTGLHLRRQKLHSLDSLKPRFYRLQWPRVTAGGTTPKHRVKSTCADWQLDAQFSSTPTPIWLIPFWAPKTLAGHYWVSKKKKGRLFSMKI